MYARKSLPSRLSRRCSDARRKPRPRHCPPKNADADITGEAVYTDITAYIDHTPIQSYNINGWTGIAAEDLKEYGFEIDWFADLRELYISRYSQGEITAKYSPAENKKEIGSHAAYIYSTDIKTYINGKEIQAFNIDGKTIIYIDYLQCYGNVVWNEKERTICYEYEAPWKIGLGLYYEGDTQQNISGFKVNVSKSNNGEYEIDGENLPYLSNMYIYHSKAYGTIFAVSLYQNVLFQTGELHSRLYKCLTVRYNNERIQKNADYANELMKININDKPIYIKDVDYGSGNGHSDYYFILDTNIAKEEINTINITFNQKN